MAIVPPTGRRVPAPGPSNIWPGGHIYDQGLATWARVTGEVADILGRKAAAIQRASEATEIIGRGADFSVGMARITQEAMKLPTPAEQTKYFREQSDALRQQVLDWKEGTEIAKARLLDDITGQDTKHQVAFMQAQEAQQLRNIRDRTDFAWDAALVAGDEAGARNAAQLMRDSGIISQAKYDEKIANLPVDMKLADSYIKVNTDPDTALTQLKDILADTSITEPQRTRANAWASMAESIMKDRKGQVKFLTDQQKRALVMNLLERIDKGDPEVGAAITEADVLRLPTDAKGVGQAKLGEWLGNRSREVQTTYPKAANILGDALVAIGADDQYEFRTKLADARYGDKGFLSQPHYEQIKALLDKGYRKDEGASLQAAWKSLRRSRPAWLDISEVGAPVETGLALSDADRLGMFGQFMAWFDEQRAKGKSPDPEESVVYVRKLAAVGPIIQQMKGSEIPEELLEGLNDTQRDWALRKIRQIGVEEFRKRYATGPE